MFCEKCGNIFTSKPYNKPIHCKFINPQYQTVCWDANKRLIYKMKNTKNWNREKKNLSSDEKNIYKKLFYRINSIPKEKIINECLIVFYDRYFAIGLKIIDKNNFIAFKSRHADRIKEMCNKLSVTLNFDRYITNYLLNYGCINEIIPEKIFEYTAKKYVTLKNKDRLFTKNFEQVFGIL